MIFNIFLDVSPYDILDLLGSPNSNSLKQKIQKVRFSLIFAFTLLERTCQNKEYLGEYYSFLIRNIVKKLVLLLESSSITSTGERPIEATTTPVKCEEYVFKERISGGSFQLELINNFIEQFIICP